MMHWGGPWALGSATESADWKAMANLMREMMGPYQAGGGYWFWQTHWVLELVTWVLLIALLVAAIRWLWKKGSR